MAKPKYRADYFSCGVVGGKRTGKSTRMAEVVELYQRNTGRGVIIHDPSHAAPFAKYVEIGIEDIERGYTIVDGVPKDFSKAICKVRCSVKDMPRLVAAIIENVRNRAIVFDEAATWIPRNDNAVPDYVRELILKHTNYGLHIYYIFHDLMSIPRFMRNQLWQYIIFRMPNNPQNAAWFEQRQFPSPEMFYEKFKELYQIPYDATPGHFIQAHRVINKLQEDPDGAYDMITGTRYKRVGSKLVPEDDGSFEDDDNDADNATSETKTASPPSPKATTTKSPKPNPKKSVKSSKK